MMSEQLAKKTLKEKLFIIIFEADTRAGQLFDKALIFLIVLSLVVVVVDSIESISSDFYFGIYRAGLLCTKPDAIRQKLLRHHRLDCNTTYLLGNALP